jgi:hypothetical protein
MLCSFTNRFHNFIWFLIFTFTLYCMPHLEMLLPYRLNLFLPGAEAAEAQPEDTSSKGPQSDGKRTKGTLLEKDKGDVVD